jgi:hypothetical protein
MTQFGCLLLRAVSFSSYFGDCVKQTAASAPLRHSDADADTVLAGEHAAVLDAKSQDVRSELLGPRKLARLVGVVKD